MSLPRPRSWLLVLLLLDVPVLLAVLVVGWAHGYVETYESVSDWRMAHPWSFAPSLVLVAVLVGRWWRGQKMV